MQLWDADERRGRRGETPGQVSLKWKMCSLSLSRSISLVFFLFPCVSPEWESVCIHEDQLEGIPISIEGFFPSVILFSAEGTVLFHLFKCASSVALFVRVYLGVPRASDSTPNTVTSNWCKHLCLYLNVLVHLHDQALWTDGFSRLQKGLWVLANITSWYWGQCVPVCIRKCLWL